MRIEQQLDALARQQLAALPVSGDGRGDFIRIIVVRGTRGHASREGLDFGQCFEHRRTVRNELRVARINVRSEYRSHELDINVKLIRASSSPAKSCGQLCRRAGRTADTAAARARFPGAWRTQDGGSSTSSVENPPSCAPRNPEPAGKVGE